MRDGRNLVESLYNDRELLPDSSKAKPLEIRYLNRSINVITIFGQIRFQRNYHYHTKGKSGYAPLDEELNLTGRYSPAVAKLGGRAACKSPSFKEAAEDLLCYAGVDLDPKDLERLVASIAPGLREALAQLPEGISAPKPPHPKLHKLVAKVGKLVETPKIPVLYVMADGTGTPMRRDALTETEGKGEDGKPKTKEVKLGAVFTQTIRNEDGDAVRDPESTSYVGTYEGCRKIGVLLHQEAKRRGLGVSIQVVYMGDGAAWVWKNCELTFPTAVQILDFFHASEHIYRLASAVYDEEAEQVEARAKAWCHAAKHDSPAAMIEEVKTMLEQNPQWKEAKRVAIQAEVAYFETHAQRTTYGKFRELGYFIGSGVVEAGCKVVIGKRFKQPGMFWGERGCAHLLELRCLHFGPHFELAWQKRREIVAAQKRKDIQWIADEKAA
jgi:hypothetical protein